MLETAERLAGDTPTEPIMILALKITLLFSPNATGKWEGVIEIDSSSLLEDLHFAIQSALNFDNDHHYEFYSSRTERSRARITFDDENGGLYERTIESLYPLPDRHNLYYLFDYGDNWLFKVAKAKPAKAELAERQTDPDSTYPRLVFESGNRPEQYSSSDD